MTTAVGTSGLPAVPVQVIRFACVGVTSTVVHLALFAALRAGTGAQWANLVALVVATVANTALNRRWTFEVTTATHLWRHQLQGLLLFGLTWTMSAVALAALPAVVPHASVALSTTVLGGAMAVSTVVRFVLMRTWIFRTP
jgi:putative flippase GtrA